MSQNQLFLIVGRAKHSQGKDNNVSKMKEFVITELLSYKPPIKCKPARFNEGILTIDYIYLLPYLQDATNHGKKKLTLPSNDWYMNDTRTI